MKMRTTRAISAHLTSININIIKSSYHCSSYSPKTNPIPHSSFPKLTSNRRALGGTSALPVNPHTTTPGHLFPGVDNPVPNLAITRPGIDFMSSRVPSCMQPEVPTEPPREPDMPMQPPTYEPGRTPPGVEPPSGPPEVTPNIDPPPGIDPTPEMPIPTPGPDIPTPPVPSPSNPEIPDEPRNPEIPVPVPPPSQEPGYLPPSIDPPMGPPEIVPPSPPEIIPPQIF